MANKLKPAEEQVQTMKLIQHAKEWARRIKRDVVTVYFAARNPNTPIAIRVFAVLIAGYALSPIDLIPDFIPVIGYLDDLLIVPAGVLLVIRLLPPEILVLSRLQAAAVMERPTSRIAAMFIIGVWLASLVIVLRMWMAWQ